MSTDLTMIRAELEQAQALSDDVHDPCTSYNPLAEQHLVNLSPSLIRGMLAVLDLHRESGDGDCIHACGNQAHYPCASAQAVIDAWGRQDA